MAKRIITAKRVLYHRDWCKKNIEKVRGYQQKYRDTHKKETSKRRKNWYYKNRKIILAKKDNGTIEEGVLYNYKEPLKRFEGGYGYLGTVTYSKSKDKIQCHYCGKFYQTLGIHINRKHGISAIEYKVEMKLMSQTALVGERIRENRIKWCKENANWINPMLKKYGKSRKGKPFIRNSQVIKSNQSLEKKNQEGTCPDQLLEKITKLKERLDRVPSIDEFLLEYDGRYLHPIYLTFGSWVNALKQLKFVSVQKQKQELMNPKNLLKYFKNFYKIHRRTPEVSDFKRKLLPFRGSYYRVFGTLNEARYQAGIPVKLGYFGAGGRWIYKDVMPQGVKRYGNTFVEVK